MKNVRELETYGAILIGCGIMAYTLMLASVDAPVWATIEFVMGTLFMVVGVWCVYLASQYPELAKEYLPELNSGITADELPIRNNTKVKWRCCKCGYEWITTIGHRAKRGTGCPRCNDKKASQSKMKAVVCVETGKIYESIMSAGRDVERTDSAICQALRNESRTCAGYHWQYLDE